MTSIGFTGTRKGMTLDQWKTVESLMARHWKAPGRHEWHDGDCLGADEQAHGIATFAKNVNGNLTLVGHPSNHIARSYQDFDVMNEIHPPLVRNRHIVDASDIMIAAPYEYEEVIRGSGTWATIRYAKKQNKHLYIVWPNGKFEELNGPTERLVD